MSEIKQRPVRDSNPNENTGLLENYTKIEYMSVTNQKRPVLDSNPNEIIFDSNPNEIISDPNPNEITFDSNTNEIISDSNPNETSRQPNNRDIENGRTNLHFQVCISSVSKNKWPPLKTF